MLGFIKKIINLFRAPLVQITRQNELLASIDSRLKQLSDDINGLKLMEETNCEKTIQQIEGWTWERFLRTEEALNSLYNDLSESCKIQYWENAYEKNAL